ncbi:MAG: FN3 associated domain-containing protein [Verrucomicrobiaceae bacterium]
MKFATYIRSVNIEKIRPALRLWGTALMALSAATGETLPDARISEFVAKNDTGLVDEDGETSDWIEVWNTSGVAGDFGGWFLTDDPADLQKWSFPAVEVASGERLVVFASGKDRVGLPGELHTNFKLQSSAGGYLALVKPDGVTVANVYTDYPTQIADTSYGFGLSTLGPLTLVADGAAAKWKVPTGPIAGWNEEGFDDSGWTMANMAIGYDTNGDYEFGAGGDLGTAMSGNATAYVRVPFMVDNPVEVTDLTLRMKWEDGFVAFINGVEVHRERATGAIDWDSASDAGDRDDEEAVVYADYPLSGAPLVAGENVLAIQGLNNEVGSSDFLISAELVGTEVNLDAPQVGFFPEPTPGGVNGARWDGIVGDTKFSTDRGMYASGFNLAITTSTPGATIRYTTDGSAPSETEGTIYTGPLSIGGTVVVRAMAYRDGYRSTNVDTHSYLFPEDVVSQPTMRTAITGHPVWGPQMVNALGAIPTISLSFEGNDIDRTEVPVSVELLNFEDGPKQVDAGVVRYGSYVTNFAKRSVRLHFRSRYGPKRLKFPLFEGHEYPIDPVEDFDSLDLRAGNHDMVTRGAYMSNRFADDSLLDMGQIAPHGRFVHVYFNGNYRGQYHLRERWNAAMLASYFEGEEEEYDTINANNAGRQFQTGDLQDGDLNDWNQIQSLLTGPRPYDAVKDKLDVPNLIDFMLLWSMGTSESEFRAGGSVENGVGFKFQIKDADGMLQPPSGRNLPPGGFYPADHNGPLSAMTRFRLEGDPDYKTLLADRIHEHFFNDGALTPEKNSERLLDRMDEIRVAFIAESARWASHDGTTNHTPSGWESYNNYFINTEFPALADQRVTLLKNAGMYPATIAPVLSQDGGSLVPGTGVTMGTNVATIYYTLDGSDPRLEGGAINPAAAAAAFQDPSVPRDFIVEGDVWKYLDDGSDQGTAWRDVGFDDGAWASGPSELGYGDGNEAHQVGYLDLDPDRIGPQRNATTYFRREFTVDGPSGFTNFLLGLRYDDGAAVYVNGVEVARTATLPAGAAFDTYASDGTPSESAFEPFEVPTSRFVDGVNTIAVEVHNESAGSSDMSFSLTLRGEVDQSQGSNRTDPVVLAEAGTLKARAYNTGTGEWSALTSAFFSVDSELASAANLTISEIHYHPSEPTSAEEVAVSTDRDEFEFLELLNRGAKTIDLTGVYFSEGITFAFGDDTLLGPGERMVLVSNAAAFAARYGAVAIGGEYSGHLSNDGEQITLSRVGEGVLFGVLYNDVGDWPRLADGKGFSMVLADAAGGALLNVAGNWTANAVPGGSPGVVDETQSSYGFWKQVLGITDDFSDADGDGLSPLMEYALGSSPVVPSVGVSPRVGLVNVEGSNYLTLSYGENGLASDLVYEIQQSGDLVNWQEVGSIQISPTTYRMTTPVTSTTAQYLRLHVRFK